MVLSLKLRRGTGCSTAQPSFALRNYLWLLSTNRVVLLDPAAPGFEAGLDEGLLSFRLPQYRLYVESI